MLLKSKKMPQLVTDNRVLILLSRLPERFRWPITGLVVLVVIFVWVLFFFTPLMWRIGFGKKNLKNLERQCSLLSEQVRLGRSRLGKSLNKLDLVESVDDEKVSGVDFIDSVISFAKESGVRCFYLDHETDGEFGVGVRGSFGSLIKFFNRIQNVSRLASIKKYVCEKSKDHLIDARLTILKGF